MATTTYLANPIVKIGAATPGTDITDQCKSAVLTQFVEALESTAFGVNGRSYVAGLQNHQCVLTFLMSYATSETYALLQPLVGTQLYVSVKPATGNESATNPMFELSETYLESLDIVSANLGELSEVQITLQGGALAIDVTPPGP
jgi:hypothetical protein